MIPASVGFQCPSCVSSSRAGERAPRSTLGAKLGGAGGGRGYGPRAAMRSGTGSATTLLMAALAGIWVLDLLSRGIVGSILVLSNAAVRSGELWRLVTYGFTSVGLFGLLMNLLVLWIAGRAMEDVLGRWRFLALYVLSGLGGATLSFVLGPFSLAAAGASSAVMGLLAANAVVKLRAREDIRPDISLLILLILYSVLVGFRSFGWLGLVGGILVGGLVGFVLAYAPRGNRGPAKVAGLAGVAVACVLAVSARLLLG
jgi:membrane associated rhomboid family serine protease